MGGFEEMSYGSVVCPKPRRFGFFHLSEDDIVRPLGYPINRYMEMGDPTAGTELLDVILSKGGHDSERSAIPMASSPPFFAGSPPCRASNPLIQDAQFGNERLMSGIPPFPAPSSPSSSSSSSSSSSLSSSSSCKSGPHMKFGNQPAAIRIEGFDCLSRDRSNCSISALA